MNTRYHSTENVNLYRTVARRANGSYVVIAAWSTFEKALGCCFGFYAAEKCLYETKTKEQPKSDETGGSARYCANYFSIFVQRRDPKHNDWTTVAQTLLRLDFDCIERDFPKARHYKSGEHCEAVLLARKTNKGGWVARIADTDYEGPITNSADVPSHLRPGATVNLKIGALGKDGRHVQFTWTGANVK